MRRVQVLFRLAVVVLAVSFGLEGGPAAGQVDVALIPQDSAVGASATSMASRIALVRARAALLEAREAVDEALFEVDHALATLALEPASLPDLAQARPEPAMERTSGASWRQGLAQFLVKAKSACEKTALAFAERIELLLARPRRVASSSLKTVPLPPSWPRDRDDPGEPVTTSSPSEREGVEKPASARTEIESPAPLPARSTPGEPESGAVVPAASGKDDDGDAPPPRAENP